MTKVKLKYIISNIKVYFKLKKKGEGMKRKRGRKSLKPNKTIFESMYYNNSMTVYEIADFYGVKIQTIYNWANQFKKEKEK